jgi:hypothetical protein
MSYQENQHNILESAEEGSSLKEPGSDQANNEDESVPEAQGNQTLWQRVVHFKPRLPFYLLLLLLLFKFPLEFHTFKYVVHDEALYASRVMQILEQPWADQYKIISWPRRGFLIREELLFYVSAIFAKLFGLSYNAMKILPFISHIAIFILVFVFCYKFFSYEVAIISSLFLFFQEHMLLNLQYRISCEYTVTMFFIILLTYLFFKEIIKDENQKAGYFALFGLTAGVAFDLLKAIFTFLFTLFLYAIYRKRERLFSKNYYILGVCFIIGAIPRIIQVIQLKAFFYTHQGNTLSPLELSSWWRHLKTFPSKFLSLLNFFGNDALYAHLISITFAVAFILLYFFTSKEIGRYLKESRQGGQENLQMDILLVINTYLTLYLFTFIYVNDINVPLRYMYFVYPLIAVFFGISLMMVLERFELKKAFHALVILLICLGISSNLHLMKYPDQLVYEGQQYYRVRQDHLDRIFQFLNSKQIDHVFCARTLKWHLIYSSRGKVHASARYIALTPDNKVNLIPHPPNYAVTLEKRFFDTLTAQNHCFLYTDKFMFVPPKLRNDVKASFNNFLKVNKGKYNIENIENFNIVYQVSPIT